MRNLNTRGAILRDHYLRLLRRAATWLGIASLALGAMLPSAANGAQITARSTTIGTSQVMVATTYDFKFNPGQDATVKSIKIQLCTSPLEQTSCTVPTGASLDDS